MILQPELGNIFSARLRKQYSDKCMALKGQSHENISPDENIFNKNQDLYTKREIHRICKINSKRFYEQL
jgi:hypothetical protein